VEDSFFNVGMLEKEIIRSHRRHNATLRRQLRYSSSYLVPCDHLH
jgi:hypothetical protein